MTLRNIFACLVHESPECVVDLVRNLRFLDPDSIVLLYNGGASTWLLDYRVQLEQYGAVLHPNPRTQRWGRLHDFALDCMEFALEHYPFDTLTIVDSDQLSVRPQYSTHLESFLKGRRDIGMLGNAPYLQPPNTTVGPAAAALKERELWRPFLRRFPAGEEKFVYWSFWPSTVFAADAARDLIGLFQTDAQLETILRRTRIWASEEVILPTLVSLLGYEVAGNPCSYSHVQYRATYHVSHITAAMANPDVYWVHPVPRRVQDAVRQHIRLTFNHYQPVEWRKEPMTSVRDESRPELLLTIPILDRMTHIEGWLERDEADLLIAAGARALAQQPADQSVVEVGSYCGRATVVLGSIVRAVCPAAKVYSIDPHDGKIGALDQGLIAGPPTFARFQHNIARAGIADVVVPIRSHAADVPWEKEIGFLFIDGLHDYASVSRDFSHFERWVAPGAYVAFHDYADYYPGVKALVHELLASGCYRKVRLVRSLIVLEKLSAPELNSHEQKANQQMGMLPTTRTSALELAHHPMAHASHGPLVSCLMLTSNRRRFVPQAIKHFLRQDYPNRELVVVDDGTDAVADLIPSDSRIRYVRLEGKHTVGAKRNVACENAEGEIVVHWDDDDWMADRRLSYQVAELLRTGADVCGLARLLFYAPGENLAWRYVYPEGAKPWLSGGTLCYAKDLWKNVRFPNVNVGEDARFVWSIDATHLMDLPDETFYVALVHAGNTSPKRTNDAWWHTHPADEIRRLMGDDAGFYAQLIAG